MRVKVQSVMLFQRRDLYLHVLNEVILLVHWEVKIQDNHLLTPAAVHALQ